MNLWARTMDGASGSYVQADRNARASQEPFLAGDEKSAYITGEPAQDARFVPVFVHSLEHTGGYTAEEATKVAASQLPDVLPYEPAREVSYPTKRPGAHRRCRGVFSSSAHQRKSDRGRREVPY
jgi:hypothetical protein